MKAPQSIPTPPKGLAILAMFGPGLVWCSDMIGSGEVILTTRNGAVFGIGVLWAILVGIFLKYWIGVAGARYTVCTGEGMMDMFDRIPGPRHWVVWIVLVIQLLSGSIATSALASASGVFLHELIPVSSSAAGWLVCIAALSVVWSGGFTVLKAVMSALVAIIIIGVLYVAVTVFPSLSELMKGASFSIPSVPDWAVSKAGFNANPWREILPLMGWIAGGFASQVWYTYWVMGEGFGMTHGRGYGKPADLAGLKAVDIPLARKIKGWCRVVYVDAAIAMTITTVVTIGFLIAGAGVLRPQQLAPQGEQVAFTLSRLFSSKWGILGGKLFLISGSAALISTLMVQLAGWPRLLADAFRICIPGFKKKLAWKQQFRIFLVYFFFVNTIVVYLLGYRPVFLVKIGAVCDGLLLTPLQAVFIGLGLFMVMPKLFNKKAFAIIKPHWIF
ncbi:MAG TPA: Nramp family divalent metal transporter, partial [bacterium]